MKFTSLDQFPAAMVIACEEAINQNVFYEDLFKKSVLDHMGGFCCEAKLVGVYSIDQNTDEFLKTYQLMVRDLENNVKAMPRGHYAIVERVGQSSSYSMIVSDGTGHIATGGKFNSYPVVPTANQVLDSMLGYEIYLCRKLIEKRNAHVLNENIMNSYKFYVGQVFKNLQSDELFPKHKFGTTTIVDISPDLQIKINSTKRGTKSIFSNLVTPTLLSKMIEWAKPKLANKVVDKYAAQTLI